MQFKLTNVLTTLAAMLFSFGAFAQLQGATCSTAIPLECTSALVSGYTTGIPSDNSTSGWNVCPGTSSSSNGQLWYSYTATSDLLMNINTCDAGTSFDTYLRVYTGQCGALTCVASNDDACNMKSSVNFTASAGTTYLIRVGGFASSSGTFMMSMSCLSENLGCTNPAASNYDPSATTDDGSCIIEGCTDSSAINYNAAANLDNGSCAYCNGEGSILAQLYVCAFANGPELNLSIVDDQGNVVQTVSGLNNNAIANFTICLQPGVCYTAQMSNAAGNNGWYNGYFWINGGGVQFINQSLDANLSSEIAIFSIDGTCTSIPGCTDPEASNYNPQANLDNGSCIYPVVCGEGETSMNIQLTTANFGNEVGFTIYNSNGDVVYTFGPYGFPSSTQNNALMNAAVCLPDGCYTLEMFDSFGDGWNGANLVLMLPGGPQTYNLPTGELAYASFGINAEGCQSEIIAGCMDPAAYNYNADAIISDYSCVYTGCTDPNALNYSYSASIDDGSCQYCSDTPGAVSANFYLCTFSNAQNLALQIVDADGNEVLGLSDLNNAAIMNLMLCLEPGVCYTAILSNTAGPFGWYNGYFWVSVNGNQVINTTLANGLEYLEVNFSIDGTCGPVFGCTDPNALNYNADADANDGSCVYPVLGCTDPSALNYNQAATNDDGSCFYADSCSMNLVVCNFNPGIFVTEGSFNITDEFGNIVLSGNGQNPIVYACLPDGCYAVNMFDTFGDGWDGNSDMTITVNGVSQGIFDLGFGLEFGFQMLGINSEGCEPAVLGCTDPNAINYNPEANTDDGSCVVPQDCDGTFVTIVISTQLWGSEVSWSLQDADGNEVASGDGYSSWSGGVSYACLPSGCYTMVMNDSWGDGWNGAYYMIYGDGTYAEGSLLYGSSASDMVGVNSACSDVDGCTDPEATNYNPAATIDDGSCLYNNNFNGNNGMIGLELEFTMYPNPANSGMVVNLTNLDKTDNISLTVVGIDGKVVMAERINNNATSYLHQMDVSSLSGGYYFMTIANGGVSKSVPFVKQ